MIKKLEVYSIANKSDNLYFALLADVTSSTKKEEDFDEQIATTGVELIKKLNQKYPNDEFPKFHFLYRKREWNEKEECFLGWERKRGLLTQFNEYILQNNKNLLNRRKNQEGLKSTNVKHDFYVNTIDLEKLPPIKYVITLDADTELVLNTGLELVGAMAHILNKPEIENGIVTSGHGIIQPRVGITLEASRKDKIYKIIFWNRRNRFIH